ncbi:MAG: cyclic nucleotide-binding domain-containing protein [candidate division Zixibacteria bacterium]|nr:cyclic nucleotide-binding domain-containing protein [candidate division Zixibacteria bacterium]
MSITKIQLFKQVPLFSGIPKELFNHLIKVVSERTLPAGEILFSEGDTGKTFYIIKSGKIDILKNDSASNNEIKLATRGEGDFFGEMALLESSPRFATAKAIKKTVVLELSRKNFRKIIAEYPSIALEIMSELSSRLRQADLQSIRDLQRKKEQLEKSNKKLLQTTQELKKSNESIQSANKFLETIISASQFFIVVTDNQGKIFIFNDAAKKVFNIIFSDIAWSNIDSVLKPVGNSNLLSEIEKNLAEGKTWSGDVLNLTQDNKKQFIELVGARVFDEKGDTFASLYMGRDITEEKNVERQMIFLDRMASRGEMAGEIAHELNNFLAVVMGNLELLQMEIQMSKTDKALKKINSMQGGLDKIRKFADSLMMYSSPDLKKEEFDIHSFFENELFFIKAHSRFDNIKIVFDFAKSMPLITADKSQIQQVLINLLNNAADAAENLPDRKSKIVVKTLYQPNDNSIIISVTDNGVGFVDDSLDKVFRQHFTTKERGHGFGLLAVKRVVKNHAGKVWAENNPEGGAIFYIQLPINSEEVKSAIPSNVS